MIPLVTLSVHHEVHGAGEPLLLIHGTGGSLRVWDPLLERLAARRTVIAVDLPGFGLSPRMKPGTAPTDPPASRVFSPAPSESSDTLPRTSPATRWAAGRRWRWQR